MRRTFVFSVLPVVLLLVAIAPLSWSQSECPSDENCYSDVYQVMFFDNFFNTSGIDQVVRIVNPGMQGSPISPTEGNVCAAIYVFDDKQHMEECCACPLSANDYLQLSLRNNLLRRSVTKTTRGVIKIVSEDAGACSPLTIKPTPNLRASMEHLELTTPSFTSPTATPLLSDTPFEESDLSAFEIRSLESRCGKLKNNTCTCK
jgi:hypothetical protein